VTEFSEDDPRNQAENGDEGTSSGAEESPGTESKPKTAEPAGDSPREAADQAASAPADEDELDSTGAAAEDEPSAASETEPAAGAEDEPTPAAPEESLPAAPQAEAAEPVQSEPAAAASETEPEEFEDDDATPRRKPEIPGADLIPDIVPEGEQFLDAEAQAAAEAEAEAAAARAQEEDSEFHSMPIADAAIDLAAGARYTATGKRKTAVARVTLKPGSGTYSINGKELGTFFPREPLQRMIRQPLEAVGYDARMDVVARMHGGGVAAQAGALRHGISRALIVADPNLRGELKRRGFLTRDPRVKERKKAGLKKARKRPQFSKR
jgi:small subunit ribosomal protein S9